jgi:hypothetical protein
VGLGQRDSSTGALTGQFHALDFDLALGLDHEHVGALFGVEHFGSSAFLNFDHFFLFLAALSIFKFCFGLSRTRVLVGDLDEVLRVRLLRLVALLLLEVTGLPHLVLNVGG